MMKLGALRHRVQHFIGQHHQFSDLGHGHARSYEPVRIELDQFQITLRDGLAHQGVGSVSANYAVTGYSHSDARLARIEAGAYVVWNLGDRYWEFDGDAQFAWSAGGVLRSTGWRKALSDPMSLLHAGVAYGDRDTFRIARANGSEIVFHAAETPVPEG